MGMSQSPQNIPEKYRSEWKEIALLRQQHNPPEMKVVASELPHLTGDLQGQMGGSKWEIENDKILESLFAPEVLSRYSPSMSEGLSI
jgi:hypothetical protein